MDSLSEIISFITSDSPRWLDGIERRDSTFLETRRPQIHHCASILSELLPSLEYAYAETVTEYLQQLDRIILAIDNISKTDDECGSIEGFHPPMTVETATYLRQLDMPWSKIGRVFGVSRQTMYNFRVKHSIDEPLREVTDEELQELLIQLTFEHPEAGAVYLRGCLRAMGIKVSTIRVKQHLRPIDPDGVFRRRRQRIHRRVYKVKGANYFWHMDSNHKLIMFRIVLHGCIDGYSRKIIYLKATSNNLADTVLGIFAEGVEADGLPKRVRGDKGSENVRVKDFMEAHQTETPNAYLQGRSVHNTRIERLWKETNLHISKKYKAIFRHLEYLQVLDEHDEVDIFCLAFVFLARIQQDLDSFKNFYNNHSMRTMHGKTPLQAWTVNMLQQGYFNVLNSSFPSNDDNSVSDHNYQEDPNYVDPLDWGVETDGFCEPFENGSHDSTENLIEVPPCSLHDPDVLSLALQEVLPDTLIDDGNFGMNHYMFARDFVLNHIN